MFTTACEGVMQPRVLRTAKMWEPSESERERAQIERESRKAAETYSHSGRTQHIHPPGPSAGTISWSGLFRAVIRDIGVCRESDVATLHDVLPRNNWRLAIMTNEITNIETTSATH